MGQVYVIAVSKHSGGTIILPAYMWSPELFIRMNKGGDQIVIGGNIRYHLHERSDG